MVTSLSMFLKPVPCPSHNCTECRSASVPEFVELSHPGWLTLATLSLTLTHHLQVLGWLQDPMLPAPLHTHCFLTLSSLILLALTPALWTPQWFSKNLPRLLLPSSPCDSFSSPHVTALLLPRSSPLTSSPPSRLLRCHLNKPATATF